MQIINSGIKWILKRVKYESVMNILINFLKNEVILEKYYYIIF